ncbi:hypothetical protein RB595_008745 [Gaeumannomyces hyphopodioides]
MAHRLSLRGIASRLVLLLSGMPVTSGAAVTEAPVEVDAVVVGGGFSGLMSGYELQQAGLKAVVLEAKDTVGGRSRSVKRKSGPGIIELGATWINNHTQKEVYRLTQKFGLDTAVQYLQGNSVVQGPDGEILQVPLGGANTEDPKLQELEQMFFGLLLTTETTIDIHDFDKFPVDEDVSVADWVAQKGLGGIEHLQGLTKRLVTSVVGREPEEVGAHYFLDYVKSGRGLISLSTDDENGAQYLKVKQGTTAIATGLAGAMTPGSVLVNSPVTSVTHTCDGALVTTRKGKQFKAKRVVFAIPTNTYADIDIKPALPAEKWELFPGTKPGVYAKLILSYREPWWRNAQLDGKFSSVNGPVCFSWDTSDPSLDQYSIAIFVAGDAAARWHTLPDKERRAAVVEHLATLAGAVDAKLADKARDTLEINYVEWTKEPHIWGAPTNSMGPGMLRKYGEVLRRPVGVLHFGGGETAYEWKGYLEGAVLAGSRAAKEVVSGLAKRGQVPMCLGTRGCCQARTRSMHVGIALANGRGRVA